MQPYSNILCTVKMHNELSFYFQFAVNYVKKHLIDNLVVKIKLLKVLANSSTTRNVEKVKLIEKIGKTPITKTILDFIGMPLSEYRALNPSAVISNGESHPDENGSSVNGNKKEEAKPVAISASLVLSSRVKPLEELPPIAVKSNETSSEVEKSNSSSMYDNMLSPYNNVPNAKEKQRRNSKSPAKPNEVEQTGESHSHIISS